MKKIFIVMLVALFAATSAYAVDFETSGMYEARGTWLKNGTGLQTDEPGDKVIDYGYFDHELDMTTRIRVSDETRISVNYEIRDENWLRSNTDGAVVVPGQDLDDNIEFKRVFGTHTFTSTGTTMDLGLMTGGAWATDFGNNADGRYRIKLTQDTPYGPVIGIYERNTELGSTNSSLDDSNKDDGTTYYLAMVTKLGPVNVKPLIGYGDRSDFDLNQNSDGLKLWTVQLGLDGAYDGWGFEIDSYWFNFDYDWNNSPDDDQYYGVYGKAWMQFGAANLWGAIAYDREDNGRSYGMGGDFEPLIFIGDQTNFGPNSGEISAAVLYMLGGSYAATEKLSFKAVGAYMDSNSETGFWDDASAWEFDLGFVYKITDALAYDMGFGYADIDLKENNSGQADPDGAFRWYHRMKISF